MLKYCLLVAFICVSFSSVALADSCVQNGIRLEGLMGVDGNGNLFADTRRSNNQCNCRQVRFHQSRADLDQVLSVLIAAKLSEQPVRIDLQDGKNCNTAWRVYLE
jgi:hypothetical protein